MPTFVVTHTYRLRSEPRRAELMSQHRDWLRRRVDAGSLLGAGSFADGIGAQLVFRASSAEDLRSDVATDPFVEGDVIADTSLREWNPKFGTLLDCLTAR